MLLVIEGLVSVSLRLPGDRGVELTRLGPGEVLGEVPLLDGGRHSATARVIEPARLLSLSRTDFAALVSRGHPTAFTLKRRIARITCSRLRFALTTLAETLRTDKAGELSTPPPPAETDLELCGPPASRYLRRLGTFHAFDSMALWGFLTAGRFAKCPRGARSYARGSRRRPVT